MLELGVKVLLAYLLGSLNGGLVLGKLLGGPDIRTVGSGSAGGTNALRARGKWFALGVMVIDVGKGYVGVALLPGLDPGWGGPGIDASWLPICCAAAAIAGHCYPVWFGFAGGKGAGHLHLLHIQPEYHYVLTYIQRFPYSNRYLLPQAHINLLTIFVDAYYFCFQLIFLT